MSAVLDGLVRRWPMIRLFLTGLGVIACAYYWYLLTASGGNPSDANWYWSANPNDLYPHPELLQGNGYNYSPAFELVIGWGRLLPFEVFVAIWRALLLAALVWLAGPLTLLVLFTVPVASEINAGNIQILLALSIVLGLRKQAGWAATWSFVLLTKVTPGIGLLWFAIRREWRHLAIALGVTAAIVLVTFVLWSDRWLDWVRLLTSGTPPPVPPYNLPLLPRLVAAVAIVGIGAWRGWRWTVVVGATLALPAFYTISPSLLVGVLPYLREATGRWVTWRRDATP